ncbi:hypothetical protein NAG18_23435, partial [Pseudomonas aeruginosa]|nr:hypothetical protein [Pseudomonas aeruginosa]
MNYKHIGLPYPGKKSGGAGHYLGCARCGHEVVQHEFLEIHQQQGGIKGRFKHELSHDDLWVVENRLAGGVPKG